MKMNQKNIKLVSSQQTVTAPPLKRTIPVCRPRRAKSRVGYYKILCRDCDVILAVQWKRELPKNAPNYFTQLTTCQFCNHAQITILEINEEEYQKINFSWDLDDLQSSEIAEDSNVIEGFWDLSKS